MIWLWVLGVWLILSLAIAPLLGRYIARVATHYPKVNE